LESKKTKLVEFGRYAHRHATGMTVTQAQLPIEHSIYDAAKLAYDASFLQDSAVRDLSFSM
jgi:hypothetical protein